MDRQGDLFAWAGAAPDQDEAPREKLLGARPFSSGGALTALSALGGGLFRRRRGRGGGLAQFGELGADLLGEGGVGAGFFSKIAVDLLPLRRGEVFAGEDGLGLGSVLDHEADGDIVVEREFFGRGSPGGSGLEGLREGDGHFGSVLL